VGLGAIVVVGTGFEAVSSSIPQGSEHASLLADPLPCVETMGRSMIERTIERFVRAGAEIVSVLVQVEISSTVRPFSMPFENVKVQPVADISSAITQKLVEYQGNGIDHAFVTSASLYTETDLLDLFYFHREAQQMATRAFDREVPLDLWVVDCARAQSQHDLKASLSRAQASGSSYFIREYVNRLANPKDLRRLVADALRGRCAVRPSGIETKPGIWVEEGVEIHRRARIVSPAYIGAGSNIREDTLITRCSSIERGCYVDYGTAIEDSSILANTHIGIWLDVCHAVANGNKLLNLERNVTLEISDPSIMHAIGSRGTINSFNRNHEIPAAADSDSETLQPENAPAAETWRLGVNLIQG